MSHRLTTSKFINKFKIKILANRGDVFKLIKDQLDFSKFGRNKKPSFEIVFNLKSIDYRDIPEGKFDIFQQYPLFQNEYIKNSKFVLNAGLRTIRVSADYKKNYIDVYVASGQDIDKDLFFDLVFFQPLKHLLGFHKLFLLHASCAAKGLSAVLFSGKPESGKSTLCLSLVRDGFNFISDDDTLLQQKGKTVECFSLPFKPKIKDNLIKYFPEIKNKYLKYTHKAQKKIIDIQRLYPNCLQMQAIPKLIIFPKFSKISKTKITPLSKRETMQRLIEGELKLFRGQYQQVSKRHFKILSNLVNQVKTYQLYYKDEDINKIPDIVKKLL